MGFHGREFRVRHFRAATPGRLRLRRGPVRLCRTLSPTASNLFAGQPNGEQNLVCLRNAVPSCRWILSFLAAASIVVFISGIRWAGKGPSIDTVAGILGQVRFAPTGSGLQRQRDRRYEGRFHLGWFGLARQPRVESGLNDQLSSEDSDDVFRHCPFMRRSNNSTPDLTKIPCVQFVAIALERKIMHRVLMTVRIGRRGSGTNLA
jgi:hypothetical protein